MAYAYIHQSMFVYACVVDGGRDRVAVYWVHGCVSLGVGTFAEESTRTLGAERPTVMARSMVLVIAKLHRDAERS